MRAACGLSAAVSLKAEPNMWEDVCWRLRLSRWVPRSFSPSASLLPLSVLSVAVRAMTYVKVLQSCLGPAVWVWVCVRMCWWSHATLSTHVLKQGYRPRLPHFRIELFSRPSVTPACCVTDQWLFATDTEISLSASFSQLYLTTAGLRPHCLCSHCLLLWGWVRTEWDKSTFI